MQPFGRPPDLNTPKFNVWSGPLPDGVDPAPASMTVDYETEEPFETRVYALENDPVVDGWLFKILSKLRKSDGQIMAVLKLQDATKKVVYESTSGRWMTRAEFEDIVPKVLIRVHQAVQVSFPNATLSEPTVTDGKTMLRMMEEVRA